MVESLTAQEVTSLHQAYRVIDIRNQCREYMTNDNREISHDQQKNWFFTVYLQNHLFIPRINLLYLYYGNAHTDPLGFGFWKLQDDKYWVTGGLVPEVRGKGLGKQLFKHLIETIPSEEIYLEVLRTNIPAIKLYAKLGFTVFDDTIDNIIVMIKKKE